MTKDQKLGVFYIEFSKQVIRLGGRAAVVESLQMYYFIMVMKNCGCKLINDFIAIGEISSVSFEH